MNLKSVVNKLIEAGKICDSLKLTEGALFAKYGGWDKLARKVLVDFYREDGEYVVTREYDRNEIAGKWRKFSQSSK